MYSTFHKDGHTHTYHYFTLWNEFLATSGHLQPHGYHVPTLDFVPLNFTSSKDTTGLNQRGGDPEQREWGRDAGRWRALVLWSRRWLAQGNRQQALRLLFTINAYPAQWWKQACEDRQGGLVTAKALSLPTSIAEAGYGGTFL